MPILCSSMQAPTFLSWSTTDQDLARFIQYVAHACLAPCRLVLGLRRTCQRTCKQMKAGILQKWRSIRKPPQRWTAYPHPYTCWQTPRCSSASHRLRSEHDNVIWKSSDAFCGLCLARTCCSLRFLCVSQSQTGQHTDCSSQLDQFCELSAQQAV